ncbi:MAG: T9SS type A sorting domain-containing protein [Bacteroidota bacterium]
MIRISVLICLLLPLFYLPLTSFKPLSSTPNPVLSSQEPEVFRHISNHPRLRIEVFNAAGDPIPATIYRFHKNGQTIYETGAELRKGLYLIKLITPESTRLFKLMKMH